MTSSPEYMAQAELLLKLHGHADATVEYRPYDSPDRPYSARLGPYFATIHRAYIPIAVKRHKKVVSYSNAKALYEGVKRLLDRERNDG